MPSPTERSMKLLRDEGYLVAKVEHWNAYARVRHDLFGFLDLLALKDGKKGCVGVQTTTASNLGKRIEKAMKLPALKLWLGAGNHVEFHGWRKKGKYSRWQVILRALVLVEGKIELFDF